MELSEHLFRHEAGRMVATLTRIFGVHNLGLAEDVVQEAFCQALEIWKFRGVPENPTAWLMTTAKNRALDALRRERTARTFAPELTRQLESEWTLAPTVEEEFGPAAVKDDELRMMFSCCNPRLSEEAQTALILHILCGFSVGEIASAFVSSHASIEKRITRSKKVLASSKKLFDVSGAGEFARRLPAVQRALYLLFNEGYHGASSKKVIRVELCQEAIRLTSMLLKNPPGATPSTYALAALMSLNAARLPARLDPTGNLTTLADQDRSQFDQALAEEGLKLLERAATGPELTDYHVEAAIAWVHTSAQRTEDTDWTTIISLYDQLMAIRPSPIVALNRAVAIAQRDGSQRGLDEIHAIQDSERLANYPFYHAALGELKIGSGHLEDAREHFAVALKLARNPVERSFFEHRIGVCK
jgi:RNA polymerase sigma-70 factor (ECF subfamily)